MYKRLALAGIVTALVVPATTASASSGRDHHDLPDTIDLPAGFVGEGVAVGAHDTFYAGSLPMAGLLVATCAMGSVRSSSLTRSSLPRPV